jgi:3-isopropylmalate/(R)-2-methylmalate dehydratase small subunit
MMKTTVAYAVGDDISTDEIYPGRFMATVLPTETPAFCFMDHEEFNKKLNAGQVPDNSVVLGANNFGCGSSREQAASTLKGHGLIIIAKSIARIFLQNAVNLGLETIVCPDIEASAGDELEITEGEVKNLTTGKSYEIIPHAPARQAIISAGGLIPYIRKRLVKKLAS